MEISLLQVEDALRFPYHADLERLAHRRNMEHYFADNIRIEKTSYRYTSGSSVLTWKEKKLTKYAWLASLTFSFFTIGVSALSTGSSELQKLAVDDFNICQTKHREELKHLERWVFLNSFPVHFTSIQERSTFRSKVNGWDLKLFSVFSCWGQID